MENLEHILSEHPFFQDLDPNFLSILVGCASNVRFNAGEFLIREGQEADSLFLIRHGQVAIQIDTPARGTITIQTLGEGEVLGWSWLIPPHNYRFDARATTLVRAIALDGKCLRTKCDSDHDLGYELLKRLANMIQERLHATRLQLINVYATST